MNQPNPVRYVEISANESDQRIDNFLIRELKGVPRTRIYRILRKGEVRVNGHRTKPSYRLQLGDRVRIPPIRVAAQGSPPSRKPLDQITRSILFEDERWLGLNKPAGMAVHGGSGLKYGVIEALRALKPHEPYLELVHRLDRGTSGCLLIAKRRSALRAAHAALRSDRVTKKYIALTQVGWRQQVTTVRAPLLTHLRESGERHVAVDSGGKEAKSEFHQLQRFRQGDLMNVRIFTGRTHQIRVHAAHSGFAVAGDTRYGDPEFNSAMVKFGLPGLFLHAASLKFEFDDKLQPLEISAELPDVLQSVLDKLD